MYGTLVRTKSTSRQGRKNGSLQLHLLSDEPGDGVQDDGSVAGDDVEETKTAPELRTSASAKSRGDGAADDNASEGECFADDDGISETSTFFEKDAIDALRKRRLSDATARITALERQLAAARGEVKQEKARLAALGTRLAAVEATLRLEREANRPDREALMKIAERAVDQASRMNEEACRWKSECHGLLESVTRLRAANEELAASATEPSPRPPTRTTSLRSQRSLERKRSPRSLSFSALAIPSPRALVRRLSERKSPDDGGALGDGVETRARRGFWGGEDPLEAARRGHQSIGDGIATPTHLQEGATGYAAGPAVPGEIPPWRPNAAWRAEDPPELAELRQQLSRAPSMVLGDGEAEDVFDNDSELRGLRDALEGARTALVEMRTRSSLELADSVEEELPPIPVADGPVPAPLARTMRINPGRRLPTVSGSPTSSPNRRSRGLK